MWFRSRLVYVRDDREKIIYLFFGIQVVTHILWVSEGAELVLGLPLIRPIVQEQCELCVLAASAHREVQAGHQVALLVAGEETPEIKIIY